MNPSSNRPDTNRTTLASLLLALSAALFSLPAQATELMLSLDPSKTTVSFHLGATGHDVEGVLHLSAGTIRFDPETGAAEGSIVLDAGRAETGNKKRDKTMHKKVLLSGTYPSITFEARRFEGSIDPDSPNEVTLHGIVTLAGHEHPLALSATVTLDGEQVKADLEITIPYVEWGLHNPSVVFLRVAKEVRVDIAASGTLVPTAEAATPDAR